MYCTLTHEVLFHINIASERILPVFLSEEKRQKMCGKAAGQPRLPADPSSSMGPALFWLGNSDAEFSLPGAFTRSVCSSVSAQVPSDLSAQCPYGHCSSFSVHLLQDLKRVYYKIMFFLSRWSVGLLFPKSKISEQIFVSCLVKSMCLFLVGANKIKMAQWVPRLRSPLKPCSIRSDIVWLATLIHPTKVTITSQILQALLSTEVISGILMLPIFYSPTDYTAEWRTTNCLSSCSLSYNRL